MDRCCSTEMDDKTAFRGKPAFYADVSSCYLCAGVMPISAGWLLRLSAFVTAYRVGVGCYTHLSGLVAETFRHWVQFLTDFCYAHLSGLVAETAANYHSHPAFI